MSDTSPILSMPFIQPSQAQKHVTHNEALRLLDVAVQTVVADRDQSAPPSTPEAGDCHIVAAGGSGDWAGHDGEIALFDGSLWQFFAARPGWQAQVTAEATHVVFDGTGWAVQPPELNNIDGVGIGTTADATNRLAVASDATLLTHDGNGHQLKINKALSTDTASLLFQTGWSGRAEMGTAGSDGFAVKVSSDGASWFTALEADPGTGALSLPSGAELAAGSAAAPGLRFAGDDDTGLFWAGNDQIGVSVQGNELVRFTNAGAGAGRLGLCETAPQKDLHITAVNPTIRMEDSDDGAYADLTASLGTLRYRVDDGDSQSGSAHIWMIDGAEVARMNSASRFGLGTSSPTELLDVNSDALRLRGSQTPASASAAGEAGTICWDGDYVYVCVAANTWKRAALASW